MDLQLHKKVFVVSGGAKGIGVSISKMIAREGGTAIIADSDQIANEKAIAEIRLNGGKAYAIAVDLKEPGDCKKAIEFAIDTCQRLDGIVNNAGSNDSVGLQSGSPEKFIESLQKNLFHYYNLVHYGIEHLKEHQGSIVNISSKVADTGQGNTSGYAASKGAINALTREWAAEFLRFGIRVNAVVPAEVWTPLYEQWIAKLPDPETKKKEIVQAIPFENRFTTPEEIAAMAVFLLSKVSSHTTGQIIHVDGGYTHLDRALVLRK